ncbi:MAG: peptidase [Planctomycetes bacterium]|nr:peptidase [Planctomycetota bacterium]
MSGRAQAVLAVLALSASALRAQTPPPSPPTYPGSQPPDAWFAVPGEQGFTTFYEWAQDWPRRRGEDFGATHGAMVVDADGNLLVSTDTEAAVVVIAPTGWIVTTWGKEFHGGLHGMCLVEEQGREVLYLAHTRRHEVVKTTLTGEVLWTLGAPMAAGIYADESEFVPTAVAVGPDGRIFVADGYGKSWVHQFDAERRYVRSFAGPGEEPGRTRTPHGLWLDPRGPEPLLLVCDRENHRLQWFTLDGAFVRLVDRDLQRPCNVWPLGDGRLVVADLAGRITILGADGQLVVHLGENPDPALRATNQVPRGQWRDGLFLAPHAVCVDRDGAIHVMDWNATGRITKLVPRGTFVTDLSQFGTSETPK